MNRQIPILTISGSDNTGQTGIQSDIQTISDLGGYAVTALTSVSVREESGQSRLYDLPSDIIVGQVRNVMQDLHPRAVKIGLIRDARTVRLLRDEVVGCSRVVCAPGIVSTGGVRMMEEEALLLLKRYLIPIATLIQLRCNEAELLLGMPIATDQDMVRASRLLGEMGAEWILLRGGTHAENRLTALLYDVCRDEARFFTSYNTSGWMKHGVGGTLSSAIATRLGMGDDVPTAIRIAHDYLHHQVVYAIRPENCGLRASDLYNRLTSLVASHYRQAHDVTFYADRLSITPRYLRRITEQAVGKSPAAVIGDYLFSQAQSLLDNTNMTVQQIAIYLGFSSHAIFCRFFLRHGTCSPTAYRNRHQHPREGVDPRVAMEADGRESD